MAQKEKTLVQVLINGISAIFLPIVNLLSAAGILKGILAILTATAVLSTKSETYIVLNAMGDSLFYFLPVMLAYTSANKFGVNPFTAVVISGILLYPDLTQLMEKGNTVHFLGLGLRGVTYHSSVIPIIMATGFLYLVEKALEKVIPELIKGFMIPLISIIVVGFVTLAVFGSIGAVIQPMVIFGSHWSFILIAMNNITVSGHDTILALMGPAVFAQAGAAFAVMLKSKNGAFRSVCASAVLSALFGITEPAMFGVNLPRKKPMVAVCIAGGIGGMIAGASKASALSFAFPSIATIPVFFGKGFLLFLLSCLLGFVIAFFITMFLKFDADLSVETQTR